MTTRRWMIAVLALSLQMCAARIWIRWKHFRERAEYHRQVLTFGFGGCKSCFFGLPQDLEFLATYYGHAEPRRAWHARMAKKYNLAASRPWLAVEPELPEPM